MQENACRGECFVQDDDVWNNYLKRNPCTFNCVLEPCPSCFNKHPQWYLDCHGGNCQGCNMKVFLADGNLDDIKFRPGKTCYQCGDILKHRCNVSLHTPLNWDKDKLIYCLDCRIAKLVSDDEITEEEEDHCEESDLDDSDL